MSWGQTGQLEGAGICPLCRQTKTGQTTGVVGGGGWGSERQQGTVACCVNPNCTAGQQNLARQLAQ